MNFHQNYILRILFFAVTIAYAQDAKINTLWCLGNNGAVFNTKNETIVSSNNHKLSKINASATVSDSLGNLLFYTNGHKVFNKTHQVMEGGADLNGSPLTVQTLVLPFPGKINANKYLIFSLPNVKDTSSRGIAYSIVNMNLGEKDGLGKPLGVVEQDTKNTLLNLGEDSKQSNFKAFRTEAITAVSFINENDEKEGYWVLLPYGKYLYAYKLTEEGLGSTPIKSDLKLSDNTKMNFDDVGYIVASGNLLDKEGYSHLLALGKSGSFYSSSISCIRSFDNVKGKIVEDEKLAYNVNMTYKGMVNGLLSYSAAFSEDNSLLYLGCNGSIKVVNLFSDDLEYKSLDFDNNKKSYVSKGVNNEIYVSGAGNSSFLSKIKNPLSYQESAIELDAINFKGINVDKPLPQSLSISNLGGVNCNAIILEDKELNDKVVYKGKTISAGINYIVSDKQDVVFKASDYVEFKETTDIAEGAIFEASIEKCINSAKGVFSKSEELKFDKDFLDKNSDVIIFPNPSSDYVEVLSSLSDIVSITMSSTEGKIVNRIEGVHSKFYFLDIRNLSEGVYFLKVKTNDGKLVVKKLAKKF